MNKTRTIIAAVLIAGFSAIGFAGTANADVNDCGWGMVPDTQGGVTACTPMPVNPGHRAHQQRSQELAKLPNVADNRP